ncbi:MAG: hypothetical protein IT324_04600 [Anaerolineae bacterium]|nr:hypothetical protein [Anaerolineae bacterium]
MTELIDIRIEHTDHKYLLICLLERQFPESTDYWDGNWLHPQVWVAAGGFKGDVRHYIRNDELLRFQDELETLYRTLSGKLSLILMEN